MKNLWVFLASVVSAMLAFQGTALGWSPHSSPVSYWSDDYFSLDEIRLNMLDWLENDDPLQVDDDTCLMRTHPVLTFAIIRVFEEKYGIELNPLEIQYMVWGSIEEDYDVEGTSTILCYSDISYSSVLKPHAAFGRTTFNRAFNHFIGPEENGRNSPLTDLDSMNDYLCLWPPGQVDLANSLEWAKNDPRNLMSFTELVAVYGNSADGWRAIGHILHLLEDAAVPSHTRNDAHPIKDSYEEIMSGKSPAEHNQLLNIDPSSMTIIEHSTIDPYFKELSEYARTFYFSDGTVFKDSQAGLTLPVAEGIDEDPFFNNYFKNVYGKAIALKGDAFWYFYLPNPWSGAYEFAKNKFSTIDAHVVEDGFADLGVKAVQYGAGLLKLCFDLIVDECQLRPALLSTPIPDDVLYAGWGNTFTWESNGNPDGTKYCVVINDRMNLSDPLDDVTIYNTCDPSNPTDYWLEPELDHNVRADRLSHGKNYTWTVFAKCSYGVMQAAASWENFSTMECFVDADCDDGNPCSGDMCTGDDHCQRTCTATGPEHECCLDPVCAVDPICWNCTDGDGDGFYVEGGDCGLADCRDDNIWIHPTNTNNFCDCMEPYGEGTAEICDGIDNDCDGNVDEGCPGNPIAIPTDGTPSAGQVGLDDFVLYDFDVTPDGRCYTITLTPTSGNPDLYASRYLEDVDQLADILNWDVTCPPGEVHCDASTNQGLTVDSITFQSPTGDPPYQSYIAIYGAESSEFTVAVTNGACGGPSQSLLPDTGITQCYNNTVAIGCPAPGQPFYGQDAQYVTNPMSFTVSPDGLTVTDTVTGLTWQREDDNTTRTWANAGLLT